MPTSPLFVVFCVFRGKKRLEAGGGTAASPSTQGREAAAPPAHANLGAMVLATKNTKSAFFSAFSAISAVKNNAAEVFVFNRKERKDRKELCISCFGQDYRIYKIGSTSPLFVVFCVFRGKKGLEAGGGTAASPSTQGREAAAPPAHANLGAMVLATKNTKSAFFSAFSAISAVKNNAAEVFVFNRKERRAVQLVFWTGLQDSQD